MSWKQVAIGEVAEIVSGGTPKSSVAEYWGGDVAWATPTDLSKLRGKHLVVTERSITEEGLSSCSAKVLPKKSVLFSSRAPIGLVAVNTLPTATNQGFKSFVPSDELDADFLFWWLKANRQRLEDLGTGATFKEVSKRVVSEVQIPLPPIEEQRRIAAILDKADGICHKREQALELADEFLKSVFLEMFGDPLINSKSLPTKPLSDFGKIVTGNTPPRANPRNYGNHIEWIKSDNINTPKHLLTKSSEHLSKEGMQLGRTVPAGSILVICIAGSASSIGKVAIADRDVALNQQINAITPNADVDQFFLYSQFLVGQRLIQSASTQSMKGMVSKGKFKEIEFLAPEPEEQQKFGRIFKKSLHNNNILREAHQNSHNLFASLSQRAFQGKL